jgi:glycosyltransferase involved in cell wall biosynthesis
MTEQAKSSGTGIAHAHGGVSRRRAHTQHRPHVIYVAIGFPPAAKSSAYRLRATANQFCEAGWDVTVLTIGERAWHREFGLDQSLRAGVDPRVRVVELPLAREDLETDLRTFSERRALKPGTWIADHHKRNSAMFPEPVFGGWRFALEKALLGLHKKTPADLVVTTCAPYVGLAATWKLWQTAKVPYVVDFRDGWSIDVINGKEAFAVDSVAGEWERRLFLNATALWFVNEPIAEYYRKRYPEVAARVSVARNGYDDDSVPPEIRRPSAEDGLIFGYLGTTTFPPVILDSALTAWRIARRRDPVLARSQLVFRGHTGAGALRGANSHVNLLKAAVEDGVSFAGPVPKAEVGATYGGWDALVLLLTGGKYMTSGKVYEFMASGLPIVSVHEIDHDATTVLTGHPLWTGAVGLDINRLADAYLEAGQMALTATDEMRAAARANALPYARASQLGPVIRRITEMVAPYALPAATQTTTAGSERVAS